MNLNIDEVGRETSLPQRFWAHVERDGGHLIWSGPKRFCPGRVARMPSRLLWEDQGLPLRKGGNIYRECLSEFCIAPEHYHQPPAGTGRYDKPMTERSWQNFWSRVSGLGDQCWMWGGTRTPDGYGRFDRRRAREVLAHRLAYEWKFGPVPAGLEVDHKCHSRPCVNPDHLRAVTHAMNGQNRAGASNASPTGVRGVSIDPRNGRFFAQCGAGDKRLRARFDTLEEAEAVVTAWRREHMPYSLIDQDKLKEAA